MSTGHRPTFHPAIGKQVFGGGSGYHIVSVKDQLGQKNLKFRKFGQSSQSEIRSRDYKAELEIIEEEHLLTKARDLARISSSHPPKAEKAVDAPRLLTDAPAISTDELRKKYDDADADNGDSDNDLESSDDDDDSDEDDEMELQMELERIKAERAAAQAKKDQEERDLLEKKNTDNALKGNPLVNMGDSESAKVKRRWNDDVVFRNQARDEPEHKKRFINDTIRNDFHRQFLKKFMK